MRAERYGRIVNIVSTSVREPIQGLGVSNTVRAATAGWAKTLSKELGPDGITVNNILPGSTRTGRLEALIASRAKTGNTDAETIERGMTAEIPLRRFADAGEIAAAVAFLASPAAAYITGVSLPVDGGRLASF
jgi:3-oxoacyl-[acyl-carrier protein] reductase